MSFIATGKRFEAGSRCTGTAWVGPVQAVVRLAHLPPKVSKSHFSEPATMVRADPYTQCGPGQREPTDLCTIDLTWRAQHGRLQTHLRISRGKSHRTPQLLQVFDSLKTALFRITKLVLLGPPNKEYSATSITSPPISYACRGGGGFPAACRR